MRQLILFLLSVMLLTGSLAATFGTLHLRDFELRGYVNPANDPNLPFAVPRPGVNVELTQYSPAELDANLQQIQAARFVWLRQFAYWDAIEPQPKEYDWSQWDAITAAVQRFPQLELVAVLMNSPTWARTQRSAAPLPASAPPQSPADFAAFARAFAERYGEVIDYYQIWDEPNLDDAWGLLPPQPADYAALLAAAHPAIHSADPTAAVIAAALAPTTETGGQNLSDLRYLAALYQHGAADFMDAAAAKPYGFSTSPLDRRVSEELLNFSRIIALREVMLENGDAQTALWASHWGWNALPAGWSGDASIWGQVSTEEQIRFTLQALDRTHRELPWLGAMILHHWQPAAASHSAQWGFALRQPDGTPAPLLQALQNYDHPAYPQNGLHHPRTPFARYSGLWEFSPLGADIGWLETSDSQLEFDFYGSELAMLLREDDYLAFLYPTIDGKPANATPRDSNGNAYVFLRSYSHQPETNLVPIASGLALAPHTLHIIADRGWDRWAIAGFAVSSGELATAYNQQIALGALAAGISAVLFIITAITTPWTRWLPPLGIFIRGLSFSAQLVFASLTSLAMMLAMLWTWSSQRPAFLVRDEINILLALATGGILYLSPSLLLSALAGLLLFVLIFHRLETGLLLTLLWAPFFLFPIELYRFAFPMAEVMLLITAAAGLFRCAVNLGQARQMANSAYPLLPKSLLSHLNLMDAALICLALLAALSLLWTRKTDVALTELRTLIIEPLLFYALFRSLRPTKALHIRFALTLTAAGTLVALIGLFLYLQGEAGIGIITAEGGAKRLASVYGSPNNAALLLERALPFALAFLLIPVARRWQAAAAAAAFAMGSALLLTQSVGALLLGIPISAAVMAVARYRRRAIIPVIGIGALAAAAFALLLPLSARFANLLDFSSGTNFFRLRLWESTLEIIRDHPLSGIGLDQFLYLFSSEYIRPDAIWDIDLSHPHNVILDFWTRFGIIGVVLFAVIQAAFWYSAASALTRFRQRDSQLFAITLALMGSMAALLAHGMIDNSVFVIDLAFIFAFQLGAAVSLKNLAQSRPP